MVIKEKHENKMVFQDKNGTYTLIKNKNALNGNEWVLVSLSSENGLNIEAFLNVFGEYIKLMVIQGNMERSMLINNGEVVDDKIKIYNDGSSYEESVYINIINEPVNLKKYLVQGHNFVNSNGKNCYGAVSNNYYLSTFLKYNDLLSRESKMNTKKHKGM